MIDFHRLRTWLSWNPKWVSAWNQCVDSTFSLKNGHQCRQLRIALGQFLTLFCGPHHTWRPAIGSVLIFFFNQIKKKFRNPKWVLPDNHALKTTWSVFSLLAVEQPVIISLLNYHCGVFFNIKPRSSLSFASCHFVTFPITLHSNRINRFTQKFWFSSE